MDINEARAIWSASRVRDVRRSLNAKALAGREQEADVLDDVSAFSPFRLHARATRSDIALKSLSREELLQEIVELQEELELLRDKGKLIARELDLFRQRRAIFWSDRFRNTFDAWNLMNPGFQQLKDDSAVFNGNLDGYRLQPSISLLRVPYVSYKVKLNIANLCGVLLAPVVEIPLTTGEITLQILGTSQELLVSSVAPISEVSDDRPTRFLFPAIPDSHRQELILKVYVQGVDAPIRVFELRRYALNGFGRLSTKPFAGYIFA
ncbi:MAG TPA: hypothetical protein V6D17_08330 [Candidatus Obscuribacterales bacterium]